MIITAHQPNYLPWIGLFHKIALAEQHVIYDDVEITHYGYANRANILGRDGVKTLVVPIHRDSWNRPLMTDIRIDNSNERWRRKHWMSIQYGYGKAPYFDKYRRRFEDIYARPWDRLVDLNTCGLEVILDCLGLQTPVVRASTLGLSGTKADRVIALCRALGATAFIFGSSGRTYADPEAFHAAGIEPLLQQYRHPSYAQLGGRDEHFLAVIDLLFNLGPKSLEHIMAGQEGIEEMRRRCRAALIA